MQIRGPHIGEQAPKIGGKTKQDTKMCKYIYS